MKPCRYGITEDGPGAFELVYLAEDAKGRWLLLRGARQQVEVRVTNSGMLRVGEVVKASTLRASGVVLV